MRIGINITALDNDGHPHDAKAIAKKAQMVEAAGLDGIWINDASYFRGRYTQVDPLIWQLLAATATEPIEVGTSVYQVTLREPIDVAQHLMTIEAVVPGRFTVGVGVGSNRAGFAAVGIPFEDRFSIFYEKMDKVRRLLDGEIVGEAELHPWPEVRGGPHFVLGAWHSEVTLKRAVAEYDGWMGSSGFTNFGVMSEAIKRYRDLGGTRAMTTTCRIDLRAPNATLSDDENFNLACGPEEAAERIGRVADLGYDDICLNFANGALEPGRGANYTMDDLEEIRSLLPRDTRKPFAE